MANNKWFYFVFWFIGGLLCVGNALQYLFSGQQYFNSNLRNSLVIGQLIFGAVIAFYGFKFYRLKSLQ